MVAKDGGVGCGYGDEDAGEVLDGEAAWMFREFGVRVDGWDGDTVPMAQVLLLYW